VDAARRGRDCTLRELPAGASPRPIQGQRRVLGVPQPLRDFFCSEGPVFGLQVTIEQLSDFFRSARLPDLVQRS
jgi:hypothetical protein